MAFDSRLASHEGSPPAQAPAVGRIGRAPGGRATRRRHARTSVRWPTIVQGESRRLHIETLDVSSVAVRIRSTRALQPGALVGLRLCPPGRLPLDTRAVVWRTDAEGTVLLFLDIRLGSAVPMSGAVPPSAGGPSAAHGAGQSKSVLLVEDDPEVRALARGALEANGYTVLDAGEDPVRAIWQARMHPGSIDLLIADIVMPVMDGRRLFDRLAPLQPRMKSLFMSTYQVAGTPPSGGSFLKKPFTPDQLISKVSELLKTPSAFARPPAASLQR